MAKCNSTSIIAASDKNYGSLAVGLACTILKRIKHRLYHWSPLVELHICSSSILHERIYSSNMGNMYKKRYAQKKRK